MTMPQEWYDANKEVDRRYHLNQTSVGRINHITDFVMDKINENAALRARVEQLEAALKPFSEMYREIRAQDEYTSRAMVYMSSLAGAVDALTIQNASTPQPEPPTPTPSQYAQAQIERAEQDKRDESQGKK